jgi:dTDP-4-amino-4,6-dideoxygalactose transaminase
MNPINIPFHRPTIDQAEIDEVVATLKSGWLTTGPRTAALEQEFKTYVGAPYAQAVNSCTAGLHLSLAGLGIGPGMEVITTPLTFCATVNVILHSGATPVLADVGPDGNIDPESVASRITAKTRAIMPVHLAGLPCHMDAIWDIARAHGLLVIEDAAHAAGARYHGQPVGAAVDGASGSDAAVFSFYATKNMTTGEGGMITTASETLAEKVKILCLHGISKNAWDRYTDRGHWLYDVLFAGYKYNLTDLQSAIGIHQLRKLDEFIETRKRYAALYDQLLGDVEELELPPDRTDSRHAWHLYVPRLRLEKLGIDRDQFITALRERGIGSSVHFIPIPLHRFFASFAGRPENQCPRALALYPRIVSLPLYPGMTESEVEVVAAATRDILQKARKGRPVAVAAAVAMAG